MPSHSDHYREAVENYRNGVTDFLGMPIPSTPKQLFSERVGLFLNYGFTISDASRLRRAS